MSTRTLPGRDISCPTPPERLAPAPVRRSGVGSTLAVLGGILVVAACLRSLSLSARSFWLDEAFTWRLITFPLPEMLARCADDTQPPLYYILLKLWSGFFGTSAVALRSLNATNGCLTVLGMYLFAREVFALNTGAKGGAERESSARGFASTVAALVALSAFQIRYSWEMRPYALGATLAAFSSWALCRALRAGSSRGWWAMYGMLALLFTFSHYYALLSVAAQALFVLGYLLVRHQGSLRGLTRDAAFRGALLAATIVAAGWLPWLPVFLEQHRRVHNDFWPDPVTSWSLPRVCYQMFVYPEYIPTPSYRGELLAIDLAVLVLVALARRARAGDGIVLTGALVPFGLSILASAFGTRVFMLRGFLFAHLSLLVALALLLWRMPRPGLRRGAIACVLVLGAAVDVWFWQSADFGHHPGVRGAAAHVDQLRQPGEPVVVASALWYLPVCYHLEDRSHCFLYEGERPVKFYQGTAVLAAAERLTRSGLQALAARRVWVVNAEGGHWGQLQVPMPPGWIRRDVQVFPEVFDLGRLVVVCYEQPAE